MALERAQADAAKRAAEEKAAAAAAGGGSTPEGSNGDEAKEHPDLGKLYAIVCLSLTPVKMAARRLPPKQKYQCPPFCVLLVGEVDRARYLRASRNPIGGVNPAHVWARLRHADLNLDVALAGHEKLGNDAPVDPKKFRKYFRKQEPLVAWNPVWLPLGVQTVTEKQAKAWLKNYRIHLSRWIPAYVEALVNAPEEGKRAADAPNRGKPYVQEVEKVRDFGERRVIWLKKDSSRGIGVGDLKAPVGPGAKRINRRSVPANA